MTPVDQTTFGHPGGNCYSACVASILGLPVSEVPYFMDDPPPAWHERLDAFLAPRGLYALHFQIADREIYDRNNLWPKGFYILCGKSPRGDHAVVGCGPNVAHDPHPSRAGLTEVDGFALIVPLFGDVAAESTRWMVRNASPPASTPGTPGDQGSGR